MTGNGFSPSLLGGAVVSAGFFQCRLHLFDRDDTRRIYHGVDLSESLKSVGHLFHTVQPFQGGLTDIVSADIKYDGRKRYGVFVNSTGNRSQKGRCHRQKQNSGFHERFSVDKFVYMVFIA